MNIPLIISQQRSGPDRPAITPADIAPGPFIIDSLDGLQTRGFDRLTAGAQMSTERTRPEAASEKIPFSRVLQWIGELPRREPPSPAADGFKGTITEDLQHGQLFLCSYGNGVALAFKGTPGFIYRWFNWAINTGVIPPSSPLNWFYGRDSGQIAYICPKRREDVVRGLAETFHQEILRERFTTRGATWDDEQIAPLARQRAEDFLTAYVEIDPTVLSNLSVDEQVESRDRGPRMRPPKYGVKNRTEGASASVVGSGHVYQQTHHGVAGQPWGAGAD